MKIRRPKSEAAFTMIEIAISLAIIGFALVAIIGILPRGMGFQKQNRQETIIKQDASMFIEAIRTGARGMDDLTNYVLAITNWAREYTPQGQFVANRYEWFTRTASQMNPPFVLTNGGRIIGLLSMPKYLYRPAAPGKLPNYISNHVVATVLSMSGPASEKFPQTDPTIQDFALSYRLIAELAPYGTNYYNPEWTNYGAVPISNTNEIIARSNYMILVKNYEANMHDLRLTFRWPVLPNGDVGPSQQKFRTVVSGSILLTNDFGYPPGISNLFYVQPRNFVQIKP